MAFYGSLSRTTFFHVVAIITFTKINLAGVIKVDSTYPILIDANETVVTEFTTVPLKVLVTIKSYDPQK